MPHVGPIFWRTCDLTQTRYDFTVRNFVVDFVDPEDLRSIVRFTAAMCHIAYSTVRKILSSFKQW
jgi:hypothetical protein